MIHFTPTPMQYHMFMLIWIMIGVLTFFYLLRREAPYGRFSNANWGPMMSNRLGWILMEATVMVTLVLWIPFNRFDWQGPIAVMIALFAIHYIHRSLIYPFMIRTKGKKMPVAIMLSAILFNAINGSLLGIWFTRFAVYPEGWLTSPIFISGLLLFLLGMIINWTADYKLIHLRQAGETGYRIPYGGLFQYISSPNLFGEIVEWTGFAVLTWSWPALAFLIWTCANLIPRALFVHRWYKKTFSEYSSDRKVLFPFLW